MHRLTNHSTGAARKVAPPINWGVEALEKVPKQILGRDAEKSDLIERAPINDLMLGEGSKAPETPPLDHKCWTFSTAR